MPTVLSQTTTAAYMPWPTVRAGRPASLPRGCSCRGRRAVLDALTQLFQNINAEIYNWAHDRAELRGATTTATLVLLDGRGAYIAHVGDSRLYLHHGPDLRQLTADHTMAEELIRIGQLKREEADGFRYRGVVSRILGERALCRPDLAYLDVTPGAHLLLCSDGLTDYVPDRELVSILGRSVADLSQPLVDLALHNGGSDNVTAVVMTIVPVGESRTVVSPVLGTFQATQNLDLLAGLSFCQHLSRDELMKVLRYVHEVQLLPGAVVFREGEEGQDLFLVVSGTLQVEVERQVVNQLGPGAHFGEIALVSGQPRSATVVAREPTRLLRLSREDFFDLSQRDQAVAVKMLWSFAQTLAGRVTGLSKEVAEFKKHGIALAADNTLGVKMVQQLRRPSDK
jgi:serine/threonine protein phosphatase PrpC/CRP-like cAMP-binding protein